jgi:magnesium-protoporphyrin IX monomethyl ester (oxidative) cyclase
MKIVLINPSYYYQTPFQQVSEPLGLLYLAAYIRHYSQHRVAIVDCLDTLEISKVSGGLFRYGVSLEKMIERIAREKPDIVGLTNIFSRKKDDFFNCAQAIRQHFPSVALVTGGTYSSLQPEEVIRESCVDYAIIGEGEESLVSLLEALEMGDTAPHGIEGLAYRLQGEVHLTPKQHYIKDLDRLPFPARNLINYETYLNSKHVLHGLGLKRAASILTSRSCPNRCNFCSMSKVHGPKWRARSAANVVAEIAELVLKYGVQELFIMDDNFTLSKQRILDICAGIKEKGLKIHWNTPNGLAINTLDEEVLKEMKTAGLSHICVAIETGDNELRNMVIGKRLKDDQIEKVVRAASKLNLHVTAFYIIGMPGETEEKFRKTLEQIRRLPLNAVAAAFANPLPGTKLYDDCQKNNWTILREDDHSGNPFYKPFIITDHFTEADLINREKRFYRTFAKAKFLTLIKDAVLFRNKLLYPPYLMRIIKERLVR